MKKLYIITFLGVWLSLFFTTNSYANQPKLIFEDLVIATKAIMTINIGESNRVYQIYDNGNKMSIHFDIKVDVSAMFLSYHRKSEVDAWYDKSGLVWFISEINDDGKITVLNGQRKMEVGEKEIIHIFGFINGQPVNKKYPFSMIHYTNLEHYSFAAAMTRTKTTWRILNLFNGEIEMVRSTPEGIIKCPELDGEYCYQVSIWSQAQQAVFHYDMNGIMVHADGNDKLGHFILLPTNQRKNKKNSSIGSFFSYNLTRDPDPRVEKTNLSMVF